MSYFNVETAILDRNLLKLTQNIIYLKPFIKAEAFL